MSDIVERLRADADFIDRDTYDECWEVKETARGKRLREAADAITTLRDENERMREALEPFANSLIAQTNVEHHSQDWREETSDTVVSISTSHQRKGMPYLSPDHTLWVGAFRRARAALKERVQP